MRSMSNPEDALELAYARRTQQLHEARGALAEIVSTLRVDLLQQRQTSDLVAADNLTLREHAAALTVEVQRLTEQVVELDAELRRAREQIARFRNMKIVRWSEWPRSVVFRFRAHG